MNALVPDHVWRAALPPEHFAKEQFTAADGVRIQYSLYNSLRPRPFGTVCLLQGRNEYIDKYHETIGDLRRMNFVVATMDWRGQGSSEPAQRPNPNPSFAAYASDLQFFMHEIVQKECPGPHYALAHSMGGVPALLHASQREHCAWEKLAVTAPMIYIPLASHPMIRPFMAMASGVSQLRDIKFDSDVPPPFDTNPMTSDMARYDHNNAALAANPSLGAGRPTVAWLAAANRSIRQIQHAATTIEIPTLFVLPGNDQVVRMDAAEQFARRVPNATIVKIPNCKHEVLQEADPIRREALGPIHKFFCGPALAA